MPVKDYKAKRRQREEFKIVLEEKTITLPKVFPAQVILDMEADEIERIEKGEIKEEDAGRIGYGIIEKVFGEEDWKAVLKEIGIQEVPELMRDILSYYGMGRNQGEVPKAPLAAVPETETDPEIVEETPDPASPSETSLNTGESSTLTLNGTGQSSSEPSTTEPSTTSTSSSGSEASPPIVSS